MRLIKMLGLAAIAAVAAMAFLGASSASANNTDIVLCKVAELVCAPANRHPNPTTVVGHATNPKLSTSIGTMECEKSLAELTLLNELAKLMISHILALSFEGNCHLGSTKCTITTGPLGLTSLVKTGPLSANVTSTGGTEASVKCGFLINCTYGGEPVLEAHSNGAGETHLLANGTSLERSTGFCPETTKWTADYLALGTYYIES